jgi:hypothetical protein
MRVVHYMNLSLRLIDYHQTPTQLVHRRQLLLPLVPDGVLYLIHLKNLFPTYSLLLVLGQHLFDQIDQGLGSVVFWDYQFS